MRVLEDRFTSIVAGKISRYLRELKAEGHPSPAVLILAHEIFEAFTLWDAARYLRLSPELNGAVLFEPFFRSLSANANSKEEKPSEFVAHSLVSQELVRDFPDFRYVLELQMRFVGADSAGLGLRFPELLRKKWSKVMLLELGMLEQPSIEAYIESVRYLPEQKWTRLMQGKPSPEETLRAADAEELSTPVVYHGFLSLLGSISAINDAISDVETSEESADSTQMREYVRNAINWRLDIRSPQVTKRFELLRKYVIADASQEVFGAGRYKLREQLEEILDGVVGSVPA